MNYLAHSLLSPDHPEALMGNLWGDLLKPMDYVHLTPGVMEGVSLHKKIDAFTDAHPAVHEMKHLIRPAQGKYTPVVTDVLMDFMLSSAWELYANKSIDAHCNATYIMVETELHRLPERLFPRISRMLSHRWLESCKNRTRMAETLQMLGHRAAFQNNIPYAMDIYDLHEDRLNALFAEFFGEAFGQFYPSK